MIASLPLVAAGGPDVTLSSTFSAVLLAAAGAFALFAVVLLYRVVRGPTTQDRIVAINVVGTNTVIVIALLSVAFGEYGGELLAGTLSHDLATPGTDPAHVLYSEQGNWERAGQTPAGVWALAVGGVY